MEFNFIDNSQAIFQELYNKTARALVRIGEQARGYAQDLCPVDTGNLRNSITYRVDMADKSTTIGTVVEYGPYVEFGTGEFATVGVGRHTPWVYQDGNGDWHWTRGNIAQPFLKPAIANHGQTYMNIWEDELKNG